MIKDFFKIFYKQESSIPKACLAVLATLMLGVIYSKKYPNISKRKNGNYKNPINTKGEN